MLSLVDANTKLTKSENLCNLIDDAYAVFSKWIMLPSEKDELPKTEGENQAPLIPTYRIVAAFSS